MRVKHCKYRRTTLNRFDLLGFKETGLSKAFAYLLAVDPVVFYRFVQDLGISTKNTESNFREIAIDIEEHREEGRTDIEIRHKGKFHVIVECKVAKNRIRKQRDQYKSCFNEEPQKVLCFITKERDCNRELSAGIDIRYRGWLDIIALVDQKDIDRSPIVREFIEYATKRFKMRDQKEVLVQDLSDSTEIRRYEENLIYRRDVTFGTPLYFAPYFTRASGQGEGIRYLSKILAVLTISAKDIGSFEDELRGYADNDMDLVEKWLSGVQMDNSEESRTYYFLAAPVALNRALMKDGGIAKGRGKNWIAAKIPKNRCVTFSEFTKRLVSTSA
jgi:hypothetical protein